ncbi:MAG: S26 family signal peptidase [Gluconobacter potus]|uniref:S26 family signal peptidase n=1 Tax=Gluconobacter potus TaxID=2724927 RepID=A0ABR9YJH7_9PROT|nr:MULTISPECIES: S26 family signal peptidase [Gluconobacter]MBF0864330.1 S26 family signal peptidase [Gluconobacter sp. R71656]MBF0867788.1 S26 family signal peptidase [Gluconobacter sp. R75628]MBF0872713.1 S26 family signal peptidase [Gluconobacter sp. R75629]MBF0881959.1 S26 family signal peptidase [Gluconobacter potus]
MTRFGYVMATYFAAMGVAVAAIVPVPVKLLWNASASAPLGLYDLTASNGLKAGDLVAVRPPKPLADFIVGRGYIGRGVPLLKPVAALPGQQVCRVGRIVTVDDVRLGEAQDRDRRGRVLPVWQGCRRIGPDQIFLMNPAVRDSLDGRYFGPLPRAGVIGRATPLYTDARGDGHFVWHGLFAERSMPILSHIATETSHAADR